VFKFRTGRVSSEELWNFRSQELSLPGAKMMWNFRSRERKRRRTFVPGSEKVVELLLSVTNKKINTPTSRVSFRDKQVLIDTSDLSSVPLKTL